MLAAMEFPFDKMQACGNDFVVLDRIASPAVPVPAGDVVRHLADRRRGIGFDQLLVLEAPPPAVSGGRPGAGAAAGADRAPAAGDAAAVAGAGTGGAGAQGVAGADVAGAGDDRGAGRHRTPVAAYRILNADGSPAEQCGNGARCLALLLHERHKAPATFTMLAPKGLICAEVRGDAVSVSMGVPVLAALPAGTVVATGPDIRQAVEVGGETVTLTAVSMGNPHAVVLVDDIAAAPVASLAPALQRHAAFPEGVNVGFLQAIDRGRGRLRVVERGAGETLACGSGACAAAVAGMRIGIFDDTVTLDLPGGGLVVSWRGTGTEVWLQGPAQRVFKGQITL